MLKRALIIEKMPCHQEIIPSWVWALTRLGYTVDIVAKAPPHRDISHTMQEVMALTGFTFIDERQVDLRCYDVILNNSLYPGDMVPNFRPGQKTFSVLHTLPEKTLAYKDFRTLRHPDHTLLALGPHMHAVVSDPLHAFQSEWAPPIFFGNPPSIHKNRYTFLVQGTMERFRRNYGCLASLINRFAGDAANAFEVRLMGDGGKGVVNWLAPQIDTPHKTRLVAVLNSGYDQFLAEIRKAGWVMPCVDKSFTHGYFDRKITSSVMMGIGNCTPLLLHQRLAEIYGLQNRVNCLTYDDAKDSLSAAFKTALEMPEEDYYRLVAEARQVRLKWLDQLIQAFT
jgi:hypothetical protein